MLKRRDFMIGCGLAAASAPAAVVKRELPKVDLKFISEKMTLLRRSEWTNSSVKTWRLRGTGPFDRITIHHSAGGVNKRTARSDVANDMEGVLATHSGRGYGDIGYHLVIDYAGRIWEGRSLAYEGAHVADQNKDNLGIMLLGNFELQDPSVKQLASLEKLVKILREQYRIKKHRIYGHRDIGKSACPGESLYKHIVAMKK